MEGYADLGEEDFKILPTKARLRRIPHLLKGVAARQTRFGVHASEREVIVLRLEVSALLLDQLGGEPGDNSYDTSVSNGSEMAKM